MALSDRCIEVLEDLTKWFVTETDRGYHNRELSRLINAMFKLADFYALHTLTPGTPRRTIGRYANGVVVHLLLKEAASQQATHFLPVMAAIMTINKRLAKSVDQVFDTNNGPNKLIEHIRNPTDIDRLAALQKRLTAAK